MDYQELLPLGSIVLLEGAERKLMIVGRIVSDGKLEKIYDYVGVLYPTGVSGENDQYFFDRGDIDVVLYIGYQDFEELAYRGEILSEIEEDDLVIQDGKIVLKEV